MIKEIKQKCSNMFFSKKEQEKKNSPDFCKNFSYEILKNGNIKILLHGQYEITKDNPYFEHLSLYVFLANEKNKNNKCELREKFNIEYFPSFQFALANSKMQQEKCTICLCEFETKSHKQLQNQFFKINEDDIYMLKCSHIFHLGCLKNLIGEKDWAKCPICSTIFGIMKGDQPQGTMDVTFDKFRDIPGHEKGAIVINYHMKSGYRNGKSFSGTSRTAYLPDNKEGRQVLELFREAFKRKLIFTVGRSVTTGLDNQTVWNGIHHKTSTSGGVASFGYPDLTYLTRVKQELAAKGITLESINQQRI